MLKPIAASQLGECPARPESPPDPAWQTLQKHRLAAGRTQAELAELADLIDELDVKGILAFAERVMPRASDVWIQASLAQRQQLQKLFFPEGIRFDGKSIVRTPPRPLAFNWLEAFRAGEKGVVEHLHEFEPAHPVAASVGAPPRLRESDRHSRGLSRASDSLAPVPALAFRHRRRERLTPLRRRRPTYRRDSPNRW